MNPFNIFKKKDTKQDELQNKLKHDPYYKFKMFELTFEDAIAKASNLKTVGRTDDVKKEVISFCQEYLANGPGERATENDLLKIGFHFAFVYLPNLITNHWDEFLYYWKCPFPFSVCLAVKSLPTTNRKLTVEQLNAFDAVDGKIDDKHNFYVIKFPDPWQFQTLSGEQTEGGACFFVLFHNHLDDTKLMYALKKSSNNQNALRFIDGVTSSGHVNSFDYDPSIKAFVENTWSAHLKAEQRRANLQ